MFFFQKCYIQYCLNKSWIEELILHKKSAKAVFYTLYFCEINTPICMLLIHIPFRDIIFIHQHFFFFIPEKKSHFIAENQPQYIYFTIISSAGSGVSRHSSNLHFSS